MPLLNFKKQFAPLVELGLEDPNHPRAKRTTIRPWRKDGKDPKPGQTLYLYTGLRTQNCIRLGVVPCVQAEHICITGWGDVVLGTECQQRHGAAAIAIKDGFESFQAFMDFIKKSNGLPFLGLWVRW